MAAVAALCVQYEADFRPNMSIVVKALQPLLNTRSGPPTDTPHLWISIYVFRPQRMLKTPCVPSHMEEICTWKCPGEAIVYYLLPNLGVVDKFIKKTI